MKSKYLVLAGCLAILLVPPGSRAQMEPGVPFLLMTSSPDGNGMGGIAASTISGNPLAVLANPGQLGIASIADHFDFAIYPSFATLPALYWDSARSYMAGIVNAGVDLRRLMKVPFPIGVGFSYSHTDLTSLAYSITGPSNLLLGRLDDYTNNWSVALGIDYIVSLGLGYSYKEVVSKSPWLTGTVSTYDIGVIALVPVMKILRKASGESQDTPSNWRPEIDIGFGFSQRNMGGDRVVYDHRGDQGIQPRDAVVGLSYKLGLTTQTPSATWEVASITVAREAEDLLVEFFPAPMDSAGNVIGDPPPPQYIGGAGSIQFLNNVILGKRTGDITLRNGLEIGLAELAYLRLGSVEGPGVSYTTSGYGLHLIGLLKLLDFAAPSISSTPVVAFALRHIDIRFDHSSSTADQGYDLNEGLAFDGLSLSLR